MVTIRKEQMDAFEKAGLENFEDSMVDHVQKYFPNHYRIAGEPVIRDVVRYGIDQAKQYEFTSERDVCLYLTVMFMLGSNFDSDFMYPWARNILEGITPDPSERAVEIADKALDFMKKIGGPESRYINRAFLSLRKELPELMENQKFDEFDQYMKVKLKNIYPKKYEILGEDIIDRLINDGVGTASKYNIRAKSGYALYIGIMFFMGNAIDKEPFLPWISAILNDKSIAEHGSPEDRLYNESVVFLEKWSEKS